ncbi:glycosyltransferase [Mangrovibacter yixingensis]|uniref:glycosyltransferase n=1 Tax=Mangrovibacter yixingensis TaxID=1529639 RepID=UPI001CFA2253|nr:glycosyltransferase [Mangrovibacter yixingensis]
MTHNILIMARSLPCHALGGMEIITLDLARELARNHSCNITVLTTDTENKLYDESIDFRYIKGTPAGKYSHQWWSESVKYAEKIITNKNINIVLSVSAAGYELVKLKKKYKNIKFIFQAHGTSLGEILSKLRSLKIKSILGCIKNIIWIPKDIYIYNKFDSIVAVGELVSNQLKRGILSYCYDSDKCVLINNGVDFEKFKFDVEVRNKVRSNLSIDSKCEVFLSVSRLHMQKGILTAIDFFKKHHEKNKKSLLLVIGEGPDRDVIEEYIKKLEIRDSVFLIGKKEREDVCEYLSASDYFIFLSSRVEVGLTLNMMEAMASGLSIITNSNFKNSVDYNDCIVVSDVFDVLKNKIRDNDLTRINYLNSNYSLSVMGRKYKELFSILTKVKVS